MKCKIIIFLLFPLPALWACHGTEVGNGRSRPDLPASMSPDGKSEGSPNSSPDDKANNGDGNDTDDEVATLTERHLLVPCASPLAEAGPGVYKTAMNASFEVQTSPEGRVLFPFGDVLVKSAATMASPYAVQIEDWDSTLSCVETKTEMQTRTVTYSDGYVVSWTVDGSGLTETIQVVDDKGETIAEYGKEP